MTMENVNADAVDDTGLASLTTVVPFKQAPDEYRGLAPGISAEWMIIYPKSVIENWNVNTPIIADEHLANLPKALGSNVAYFRVPNGDAVAVTSK